VALGALMLRFGVGDAALARARAEHSAARTATKRASKRLAAILEAIPASADIRPGTSDD
jgi:hypothetical protein